MSDETYNGYKNVETWVVNLWLNSDRFIYKEILNLIKGMSVYEAGEVIGERVRDGSPIDRGMYSDIINHFLNQVDWLAIAEGFKSD